MTKKRAVQVANASIADIERAIGALASLKSSCRYQLGNNAKAIDDAVSALKAAAEDADFISETLKLDWVD